LEAREAGGVRFQPSLDKPRKLLVSEKSPDRIPR
jgi:hypothetical protein